MTDYALKVFDAHPHAGREPVREVTFSPGTLPLPQAALTALETINGDYPPGVVLYGTFTVYGYTTTVTHELPSDFSRYVFSVDGRHYLASYNETTGQYTGPLRPDVAKLSGCNWSEPAVTATHDGATR